MSIVFTLFMRPSGRPVRVEIDRPAEVEIVAAMLGRLGCRFECEVLTTGDVSFTIENDDKVLAHRICPNGPEVPSTVDDLIAEAERNAIPF